MSWDKNRFITEWLADRLALVLALADDEAIDYWLDGDAEGEAFAERIKAIALFDDDSTRYRCARLRGSPLHEKAKTQIRERVRQLLIDMEPKK